MGPILAGFLYDLTHSYTIAFGIFSGVSLLSFLLMFFAKAPARENQEIPLSA
jgi:cyanate permease